MITLDPMTDASADLAPPADVDVAPATEPGPDDPTKPKKPAAPSTPPSHVMSFAEFQAAQSAPTSALTSGDPRTATTNGVGRPLTFAEFQQAQRMSPQQIHEWTLPALPKPSASDATRQLNPNTPTDRAAVKNGVTEELLNATLGNAIEHPALAAGLPLAAAAGPLAATAVLALGIGTAGLTIARYGYQKYVERDLSPEARREVEADPEYISGQAAAAQAILLGAGSLVHVGVKAANSLTDFSEGMTEAGAQGVKESNFSPRFSEGFSDAQRRSEFAVSLEQGAAEAQQPGAGNAPRPKGFEPTVVPPTRGRAKPVEGLVVPEETKPGRVKPIETEPASAPLQAAADINQAVREHQAQRAAEDAQDIADEGTAAGADGLAERLLGLREADAARVERETTQLVRRRPGGKKSADETPLFESPEGANLLGSLAARHGLPDDASPYPPTSRLDAEWKAGHDAVTSEATTPAVPGAPTDQKYPEGFTMGGALTENRIPELPPRTGRKLSSIGKSPGQYVDRETERALTEAPGAAAAPPVEPNDQTAGAAQETTSSAEAPRTRIPRSNQTLSDDPRYPNGARRPLHLVSVKGLVKELVDLEDKRVSAAERSLYNYVPDDNFHSTIDGRSVVSADRRLSRVSRQAKALQNLEDFARIDREVTDHLVNQRGLPPDLVDDLLQREREARYDRAAAEERAGGGGADGDFNFGANEESKASEQTGQDDPFAEERRSLERRANTDPDTGLGNKGAYHAALAAAEADPNVKIIRFDGNGTKLTNDAFGHAAGDDLIKRWGAVIREVADGLPAFRVGGDEFAVIAPADQAEAVRDAIESTFGYGEVKGTHIKTGEPAVAPQSLSGGIGDTDAEADAAAYERKEQHKAKQGFPAAPGRAEPSRGLTTIEGTGDARTRGLASGVQQKALANRLELGIGELPVYRRINMADQAKRATQLLADDPDLAARVARGDAKAPEGLLPESVFVAVEQRAIEEGDVNTLRDLATGKLTTEATTMGQRIRALGERDPESPVAAIQDVINTRSGGAKNADAVAKALDDEVDALTKHLEGVTVHGNAWNHFIEALKC